MTERGYITVAQADSPAEADLLRMRLAAGGVVALVRDDNLVRMDPILAGALGGIRLDVPLEEAEIATPHGHPDRSWPDSVRRCSP